MLFKRHREIFADTLGGRLIVKPLYSFLGTLHRGSADWRKKQMRDNTTNDCAVKIFVVRQIG